MGWYIGSKLRDKAGSWGGGVVVGLFYREQKHICGKDYDTAQYMEVDLYQVSAKKHKASRRAKKKEASSLAQQTYNDKRAKRYHVQLVNTNFGKGDFSWTGTYDDDHLPAPGDYRRADLDFTNFIKRLYRWCDGPRSAAAQVGGRNGIHHRGRGWVRLRPAPPPRHHPAHGGADPGRAGGAVEREREADRADPGRVSGRGPRERGGPGALHREEQAVRPVLEAEPGVGEAEDAAAQ